VGKFRTFNYPIHESATRFPHFPIGQREVNEKIPIQATPTWMGHPHDDWLGHPPSPASGT